MIVKKLLDFLDAKLAVKVGVEAPTDLSDYVLIDQTGSRRQNHIITTTLALQSYGASLFEAMTLNEAVKTAMEEFEAENDIIKVELDTDYNFTNTATKQHRWQAVYSITHY